jgi:hypothetical protein
MCTSPTMTGMFHCGYFTPLTLTPRCWDNNMVGCVGQSVTLTHIIADTDSVVSVTKVPTVVEQCHS